MKRSKWKGLYVKPDNYKKSSVNPIMSRKTSVLPELIGQSVQVHNGKKLKNIILTKEMFSHKVGEFFRTRTEFEFKKKKKKKK